MPAVVIMRIFTWHEYLLLISDCYYGNMNIEANITGSSIDRTKIKIIDEFKIYLYIYFYGMPFYDWKVIMY